MFRNELSTLNCKTDSMCKCLKKVFTEALQKGIAFLQQELMSKDK